VEKEFDSEESGKGKSYHGREEKRKMWLKYI
jgi:hypothetical protein